MHNSYVVYVQLHFFHPQHGSDTHPYDSNLDDDEEEGYDWDRDDGDGEAVAEDNDSNNDDMQYNEESIHSYMRRSPFPLVLITRKSTPYTDSSSNNKSIFQPPSEEGGEADCLQRLSQVCNMFIQILHYQYYYVYNTNYVINCTTHHIYLPTYLPTCITIVQVGPESLTRQLERYLRMSVEDNDTM